VRAPESNWRLKVQSLKISQRDHYTRYNEIERMKNNLRRRKIKEQEAEFRSK